MPTEGAMVLMGRVAGVALLAVLAILVPGLGAAEPTEGHPGYADFGDLSGLSGVEPSVEISLGPALIRFVAAATRNEDGELADTLSKLMAIRVNVFEIPDDRVDSITARAAEISRTLEQDAWQPAVKVRKGQGSVNMYMKVDDGGLVQGMVVMMVEPGDDAVFLNIVGEIDPEQLGRVANKFGVSLDDL